MFCRGLYSTLEMLYAIKCEEILTCSLFACFPSFSLVCLTMQEKNPSCFYLDCFNCMVLHLSLYGLYKENRITMRKKK